MIADLQALFEAGGLVMWALLAVGFLAWFLLFSRAFALFDAQRLPPATEAKAKLKRQVQLQALNANTKLIASLIAAAPLLGLLGTVSGMITTFEGLAEGSLYSQGGGIASGISVALITTQAGLVIAVPCLLVSRLLSRWALRLAKASELAELEAGFGSRLMLRGGR